MYIPVGSVDGLRRSRWKKGKLLKQKTPTRHIPHAAGIVQSAEKKYVLTQTFEHHHIRSASIIKSDNFKSIQVYVFKREHLVNILIITIF